MWSFRGNACDIPTDCPHRERAGWTGDWQLFVPTAAFLYDVAGFSTKWLRDVAADQWPDGTIAQHQPDRPRGGPATARSAFLNGSAGWGDAVVMVPWELYRAYGDTAPPRRAVAGDGRAGWTVPSGSRRSRRHPSRVARRPGAGAARAVPVGHRLPLGRVAGAGRGPGRLRRVRRRGQGRRRDRLLRPLGRADGRGSPACSATTTTPTGTPSWPRASGHAWRAEFVDADGRLTPGHAGQPRAGAGLRPGARRAARRGRGAAGRADPGRRHPSRHRLPGHAVPAAGAGRRRSPRRRVRPAVLRTPSRPGWR